MSTVDGYTEAPSVWLDDGHAGGFAAAKRNLYTAIGETGYTVSLIHIEVRSR